MQYLWVGLGGFVGAVARYAIGTWIFQRTAVAFPWGTLLINISGSLLLGFLGTVGLERTGVEPQLRLGVMVGFLGAYTTFSTWSIETLKLLQGSEYLIAAANVFGSVILGLGAGWLGLLLGGIMR